MMQKEGFDERKCKKQRYTLPGYKDSIDSRVQHTWPTGDPQKTTCNET